MNTPIKNGVRHCIVVIGFCLGLQAWGCEPTLAYLASRIPIYDEVDLSELRRATLATDIRQVIEQLHSMGYSTADGARALHEQTKQFDAMIDTAREGAFEVCGSEFHEKLSRTLKAIDEGQPLPGDAIAFDDGAVGAYVKGYVVGVWGKMGNHEAAVQVTCYASN
jgi:hypothetical protein